MAGWRRCATTSSSDRKGTTSVAPTTDDLTKDPECLKNLIADPRHKDLAASLKDQLFAALKAQADPRMSGKGDLFDQYPYAGAVSDFHRRFMAGEVDAGITGWVNPSDFEKPSE